MKTPCMEKEKMRKNNFLKNVKKRHFTEKQKCQITTHVMYTLYFKIKKYEVYCKEQIIIYVVYILYLILSIPRVRGQLDIKKVKPGPGSRLIIYQGHTGL